MAELLGPAEEGVGHLPVAHRQVGHGALTGLRDGDPRAVGDAADALALHEEGVLALVEALSAPVAEHDSPEHRVVPVHRPAMLRGEGFGHVAHDVGELRGGDLPVGALVAEELGDGDRAAEAVADRAGAGEEGEAPRGAVGVSGPQDLATRGLEVEHEVDGLLDDRPHGLDEPLVVGEQPAVPHARGHVGTHVGVELVLLHLRRAVVAGDVVLVPRAVVALQGGEPLIGAVGLAVAAPDVEGHGRLDVVPRVAVAAGEPRDHPGGQLPLGDAVERGVKIGGRDQARDVDGHGYRPRPGLRA